MILVPGFEEGNVFKKDLELQSIIIQERTNGLTIREISELHPEYSEITYKRFLRDCPKGERSTEQKELDKKRNSERSKEAWSRMDPEVRAKHEDHLRRLSETKSGKKMPLSEEHIKKIREHLSSEKMQQVRLQNNHNRKKYTEEAILRAASEAGVSLEGDISNSDNSVTLIWPDGVTRKQEIKTFMRMGIRRPKNRHEAKRDKAKQRHADMGLEVLGVNEQKEATMSYKGFVWVQKWRNTVDSVAERNMRRADKALKIKEKMDSGVSLTAACKSEGVDPVTFARRMKLTGSPLQSVVTNRCYEQVLQIDGAIYNNRLPGNMVRPDIRIEDKKLIIEVDGVFWHTETYKERGYHHKKSLLYEKQGYSLLVFSQWDIENKRHVVDSMINNKLGKIENKVGARSCVITHLSKQEADAFFYNNHLKGKGAGEAIALTFKGSVVCALRWYIRKSEIHISRFCSLVNWNVQGGYSKLLKQLPNMDIVNFVDRRHGTGKHLEQYGFVKVHEHIGFEWTNGYELFNRRTFLGSSGLDKGLSRYWDYGQIKYVRKAK